jgi:hypothetical protein
MTEQLKASLRPGENGRLRRRLHRELARGTSLHSELLAPCCLLVMACGAGGQNQPVWIGQGIVALKFWWVWRRCCGLQLPQFAPPVITITVDNINITEPVLGESLGKTTRLTAV